jgi:hypothetical protein
MSVGAADPTLVTSSPVAFKKVRLGDIHLVALGVDGNAYAAGKYITNLIVRLEPKGRNWTINDEHKHFL